MAKKDLLVVGAGLTGSLSAYLLSRGAAVSPCSSVVVWEQSRGAGGRFTTHRHPKDASLHVDMGAQYISRSAQEAGTHPDEAFTSLKECVYSDLISSDVLTPFHGKIEGQRSDVGHSTVMNYAAVNGMSGVVKHFLSRASASVTFNRQLVRVDIDRSARKVLCTASNGGQADFDSVILTMPVPQILTLHGNLLASVDREVLQNLETVECSSRYAFGLFYETNTVLPETEWSAKYFDNAIVRFACWDAAKRGRSSSASGGNRTLLVHTSVPFGLQHLHSEETSVEELVLRVLSELVPGLPPPVYSHCVRWRYSQVTLPYPGTPGCVVLSHDPLVVAAGDGFTASDFENCLLSAFATTKMIR